ncbi:DUF5688 family protein [Anaerovoracaceae bacterium SGI.174]
MMNKQEFLKYETAKIHELIAERYNGEIEVRQAAVVKMNDQKLNGLSVSLDGNNVCPTIYLDDAFEAYVNGTDSDSIAMDVALQAFDAGRMAPSADTIEQLPDLSDKRLALRLLEASRNREFLKDTPYMEVGNGLVLVCDVRIQESSDGCFSTVVNNNLLKVMGRAKLFGGDETNLLDSPEHSASGMYILTNTSGIHGAAALFYPDVQQRISEVLGEDYYALPSSTEEFIIVPQSMGMGAKEFTAMVRDANRSVVEPGQVLCDSVLKYDRDAGMLHDVTAGRELGSRVSERMC